MGCPPQIQNQILLTSNLTPTPLRSTVNKVNCIWKRSFRTQSMDVVYLNEEE